jgi:hypothetical protein
MSKDSDMPMRRLVCACVVSAGVTLAFAAPLRGQGLEEMRRIRERIVDADDMMAQALADCDVVARIGLVKYYETGDDGKAN